MLYNKVIILRLESSWIVFENTYFDNNTWKLEHNVELQEILNRIMQGIVSIINSTLTCLINVSFSCNLCIYICKSACARLCTTMNIKISQYNVITKCIVITQPISPLHTEMVCRWHSRVFQRRTCSLGSVCHTGVSSVCNCDCNGGSDCNGKTKSEYTHAVTTYSHVYTYGHKYVHNC